MNFFPKQISTIFFSLIFFILSAEAWGAVNTVDISSCNPLNGTSSGVCFNTCATSGDTYNFKNGSGAGDVLYGTYVATSASDTSCKAACLVACISYKTGTGEFANASTSSNTFSKSICNAFRIVTGGAGKTFAAFAIIATGIGFFSGKVSWGLMIGVAAGIATMFGAPSIVAAISGTTVNTQCSLAAG